MGSHNQTHCKRGHRFTPENTYIMGRGKLGVNRCCRICKKLKAAEWYQKDKKQYRKAHREQLYGAGSWKHYHGQLEAQRGRCAICGIREQELGRALSQDHSHKTSELRGLLCDNCNRGIGQFRENPVTLARALDYILEWQAKLSGVTK